MYLPDDIPEVKLFITLKNHNSLTASYTFIFGNPRGISQGTTNLYVCVCVCESEREREKERERDNYLIASTC